MHAQRLMKFGKSKRCQCVRLLELEVAQNKSGEVLDVQG